MIPKLKFIDPNGLWGHGEYPLYFTGPSDLPAAVWCLICKDDMMLMCVLGVVHPLQPLWTLTLHSVAQSPVVQEITLLSSVTYLSAHQKWWTLLLPSLWFWNGLKWFMVKNGQGTRCVELLFGGCPRTWAWALERSELSVLKLFAAQRLLQNRPNYHRAVT